MTLHTEVEYADARYHGINRACTGRLLSLLKAHHDYAVRVPKDHIKPERLIVEAPAEPTPEFKELWFGVEEERKPRIPTIGRIQRAVAQHYGVRRMDIVSARRTANIVWPRQVAMYLCRNLTPNSYPQIGRMFGDRDHTTCLYAVRKVETRLMTDSKLVGDISRLTECLAPVSEAAQ